MANVAMQAGAQSIPKMFVSLLATVTLSNAAKH